MKWMIDSDFFNERIAFDCLAPSSAHDNTGHTRLICLQLLFCVSVNGAILIDANEFSRRIGRNIKQCERVWQLCIEENVLRPVDGGYSAIEWLREKGYFNDEWRNRERNSTQYQPRQNNASRPTFPANSKNFF